MGFNLGFKGLNKWLYGLQVQLVWRREGFLACARKWTQIPHLSSHLAEPSEQILENPLIIRHFLICMLKPTRPLY